MNDYFLKKFTENFTGVIDLDPDVRLEATRDEQSPLIGYFKDQTASITKQNEFFCEIDVTGIRSFDFN